MYKLLKLNPQLQCFSWDIDYRMQLYRDMKNRLLLDGMTLNDFAKRYYCFGCGEQGDVIDFTARYLGVSSYSAAIQLAQDFGIDPHPPTTLYLPNENAELTSEEEQFCILSLSREVQRLCRRKWEFAPQNVGGFGDDRFVEVCLNLDEKEHQLDLQLDPSAWRPSA